MLAALRHGAGDVAAQELKTEIEHMTAFLLEALPFEGQAPAAPRPADKRRRARR